MAAAAVTWLEGGDNEQVAHAVALTIQGMLGLICDPVAGLVEIPCAYRNATGSCERRGCRGNGPRRAGLPDPGRPGRRRDGRRRNEDGRPVPGDGARRTGGHDADGTGDCRRAPGWTELVQLQRKGTYETARDRPGSDPRNRLNRWGGHEDAVSTGARMVLGILLGAALRLGAILGLLAEDAAEADRRCSAPRWAPPRWCSRACVNLL